jgi:hypothetical protein
MALPPLTIRKPETLAARLEAIESETLQRASQSQQKSKFTVRINGRVVDFTVTPSVSPGRFYQLFYVNGKRTPRHILQERLMAAA